MLTRDQIVMYDSPEAAKPHTMQGWLSREGLFYRDEAAARYSGCTHRPCTKCGAPAPKAWLVCDDCRAKADRERYESKPAAPWDGVAMLYSETRDRYYSGPGEAEDELEDGETIEDLRLVVCEPQCAPLLETDWFSDVLPSDEYDAPDELQEAIDTFNAMMDGVVLSWVPGKARLRGEGE